VRINCNRLIPIRIINWNKNPVVICWRRFARKSGGRAIDARYRAGNAVEDKNQHNGLGLAITRKLLNILKSEIHVDSELRRDSTFSFNLNIHKPTEYTNSSGFSISFAEQLFSIISPLLDNVTSLPMRINKNSVNLPIENNQ